MYDTGVSCAQRRPKWRGIKDSARDKKTKGAPVFWEIRTLKGLRLMSDKNKNMYMYIYIYIYK